MGGAAREIGSPLQGYGSSPTPTQGDALGWYKSAPLGLNISAGQVLLGMGIGKQS